MIFIFGNLVDVIQSAAMRRLRRTYVRFVYHFGFISSLESFTGFLSRFYCFFWITKIRFSWPLRRWGNKKSFEWSTTGKNSANAKLNDFYAFARLCVKFKMDFRLFVCIAMWVSGRKMFFFSRTQIPIRTKASTSCREILCPDDRQNELSQVACFLVGQKVNFRGDFQSARRRWENIQWRKTNKQKNFHSFEGVEEENWQQSIDFRVKFIFSLPPTLTG